MNNRNSLIWSLIKLSAVNFMNDILRIINTLTQFRLKSNKHVKIQACAHNTATFKPHKNMNMHAFLHEYAGFSLHSKLIILITPLCLLFHRRHFRSRQLTHNLWVNCLDLKCLLGDDVIKPIKDTKCNDLLNYKAKYESTTDLLLSFVYPVPLFLACITSIYNCTLC